MRIRFAGLLILSTNFVHGAQLPAPGDLSDADRPAVRAEIARVGALFATVPDRATISYEMARTWAFAKQWPEAMDWLRKTVALNAGIDPSRDSVFAELRSAKEFAEVSAAVRESTPPVLNSQPAFQVPEGDLVPESMAFDPRGNRFYFGSMRKGKVCTPSGDCEKFATGLGTILGLKIRAGELWLLNNSSKSSETSSELVRYNLASREVVRRYAMAGRHLFNDLVFAPSGNVYVTDTAAGAVWWLERGTSNFAKLPGRFEHANGVAISSDGLLLYVSTFPRGIDVVNLRTGASTAIARPKELCLAQIDGLYFYRRSLIAIQNGFMTPRVVRLTLTRDLHSVRSFDVLERGNPLFDGITTGVIAGRDFFLHGGYSG